MKALPALIWTHPQGELKTSSQYPSRSWPIDTPGGRFHAEWDDQAPVTREGQIIFFSQFLQAGNRGSVALNVMGTVMLRPALCPATGATPTSTPSLATASTRAYWV